jgi:hypothetical protein
MTDEGKLTDLAERFMKLNPDFLRDIMSAHFIRFEKLEFSQGKLTKSGSIEKLYKEHKP